MKLPLGAMRHEQQETEIATLRSNLTVAQTRIAALEQALATCDGALVQMIYETTHLSAMKDNGSHDCNISKYALEKAREARAAAKAALDE